MMFNSFLWLLKGRTLFSLLATFLTLQQSCYCRVAEHVHHHKRQSQSSSLEFGVEPNQPQVSADDQYTQIGTKVNFTCTISKPQVRYTPRLVKEQFIENEPSTRKDVILPGEFAINPELDDQSGRFKLLDEEGTGFYKIIFQIDRAQLSDNGRYSCLYANLSKAINLHVYEKLQEKDTSLAVIESKTSNVLDFNSGQVDLKLKDAYRFVCNVNELYPKPRISFNINGDPITSQLDDNSEVVKRDNFYAVRSSVVADFTVEKEQNNKKFECVISPNVPSAQPVVKHVTLRVKGIEFFDGSCLQNVTAKAGDKNVEISCKFYSVPRPNHKWSVLVVEEKPAAKKSSNEVANETPENQEENVEVPKTEEPSNNMETVDDEEKEEKKNYKELETNGDDSTYSVTFDALETDSEPDTYIAVVTIKEFNSENDFKELTLNIDNGDTRIQRQFYFGAAGKAGTKAAMSGSPSTTRSIHSIILLSSIFTSFLLRKSIL